MIQPPNVMKPILKFLPLMALAGTLTSCCVVYPTTIVYVRPSDSSSGDGDASEVGTYVATLKAHPANDHSALAWKMTTRNGQATNLPPANLHLNAVAPLPKGNL